MGPRSCPCARLSRGDALPWTFPGAAPPPGSSGQAGRYDRGSAAAGLQVSARHRALRLCRLLPSACLFHLLNEIQFEAININARR